MSDLVAAAIKIVFLALLWLFIGILADVIRKDMFGRKVSASDLPANEQGPARRGKASFQPTRFAITQGAQQGLSIPLEPTINLGRTSDSTLLLDDDYASARHAQLVQRDPETWVVTDLGSTNGTMVNGHIIEQPVTLRENDEVQVGDVIMRVGRR